MFEYKKYAWFPINLPKKDLKFAKALVTQYGGP